MADPLIDAFQKGDRPRRHVAMGHGFEPVPAAALQRAEPKPDLKDVILEITGIHVQGAAYLPQHEMQIGELHPRIVVPHYPGTVKSVMLDGERTDPLQRMQQRPVVRNRLFRKIRVFPRMGEQGLAGGSADPEKRAERCDRFLLEGGQPPQLHLFGKFVCFPEIESPGVFQDEEERAVIRVWGHDHAEAGIFIEQPDDVFHVSARTQRIFETLVPKTQSDRPGLDLSGFFVVRIADVIVIRYDGTADISDA